MCLLFFLPQTHDVYRLIIEGADLGGKPGGLTGTGTVEIHVMDINDNIPTLEKSEVRNTHICTLIYPC